LQYQVTAVLQKHFLNNFMNTVVTKMIKKANAIERFAFGKQPGVAATGTHVPYGITQCHLPPGRGDIRALTPAEAGTRFSDPEGMQG